MSLRTWILATAALAAFVLSLPAAAQEAAGDDEVSAQLGADESAGFDATFVDQPKPPLVDRMSPDQLIVFLITFAQNENIQKGLQPAMAQMLTKGETVAGWQDGGVDILAHLARRDGGVAGNLLRDSDVEVLSATDFSGQVRPDLEGFESFAVRPDPVGLVAERSFISFIPGVWFEVASQRWQKGNALCYAGYFGVTLHTRTAYKRWSDDQLIRIASLFALVDALSGFEACTVYSLDKDGRYSTRSFLPDGTDLPALNAESTPASVMASDELNEFLLAVPRVDLSK